MVPNGCNLTVKVSLTACSLLLLLFLTDSLFPAAAAAPH